jgi:hypothetical protein
MSTPDLTIDIAACRQAVYDEWDRVLGAAGFSAEEVAYWTSDETPEEIKDRAAMYFLPGPDPDPPFAFTDEQLAEATSDEMSERHRIMVHLDYRLPDGLGPDGVRAYYAAVLRHELEHARQAEAPQGRAALEVDQGIVDPVLRKKAGGIKGGAEYHNMKPSEMDANAAASVYVRKYHSEAVPALLDSNIGQMVRSHTEPEDPATLLRRTLCFLVQLRAVAEGWAEPLSIAGYLAACGGTDAEEMWAQLTA